MNIEQFVYRHLADDAGVAGLIGQAGSPADAKIFPLVAPQKGGTPPYVVYQRVSTVPVHDTQAAAIQSTRIQFTCRSPTADAAADLAEAVRAALDHADIAVSGWGRVTAQHINTLDQYDDAPKSYARIIEFSIYHPS